MIICWCKSIRLVNKVSEYRCILLHLQVLRIFKCPEYLWSQWCRIQGLSLYLDSFALPLLLVCAGCLLTFVIAHQGRLKSCGVPGGHCVGVDSEKNPEYQQNSVSRRDATEELLQTRDDLDSCKRK